MTFVANDRIRSSGEFDLPLAPEEAFPLFTAEGERRWVPGWSPEILGSLPQNPGQVFLTGTSGLQTIWTVLASDPASLMHRYSRVTPRHTAGIVEVQLRPSGSGCRVQVSYDLTALADDKSILAGYAGASFAEMLAEWRALILAMLAKEAALPPA